ncbi:MazG-like family protein [Streptomyces stackebrandtii]|uniref:MazG-like family protein n=1 Tax=Streptomyces stackebrandtii TaxID=3051177 RepID=UPI0028DC4C96|nr:MazG-like family protein [Streptomyces sp. DSM 40976]
MDGTMWDGVQRLRGWLDAEGQAAAGDVRLLRVLKIGEELGEASEAVTGALGANPRKGASHGWSDVEKELSNVIVTAAVALATISPDPEKALDARVRALLERLCLD